MARETHPWLMAALEFGLKNKGWFAVTKDSPEYVEWEKYFSRLGWTPWAFKRLSRSGQEMAAWTAPCQWPAWLTIDIEATHANLQAAE